MDVYLFTLIDSKNVRKPRYRQSHKPHLAAFQWRRSSVRCRTCRAILICIYILYLRILSPKIATTEESSRVQSSGRPISSLSIKIFIYLRLPNAADPTINKPPPTLVWLTPGVGKKRRRSREGAKERGAVRVHTYVRGSKAISELLVLSLSRPTYLHSKALGLPWPLKTVAKSTWVIVYGRLCSSPWLSWPLKSACCCCW